MDFSVTSTQIDNPVDTRWRASRHGQFAAQPGVLDLTKFTSGTHFNIGGRTDGIIPSGVAVQYNSTSKMYEPWNPVAVEPETEPLPIAGYINDNQGVATKRADGTNAPTAAFARLLHGFLDAQYLPVAAQAAAVKTAVTTAQISFI
ncbi:MAG: hypothetical protein KKF42_07390 [Actinobacteria bacterium]|nr:hypothetical protein [Actinomycetota bacterium]